MTAWVFEGVELPRGEATRLHIGVGEPERLPGAFALTGLVDAHCHLTVVVDDQGPLLAGVEVAADRLDQLARAGVTTVRDVGGNRSVTLPLGASLVDGRPAIAAAGRFLSSAGRYFPRMHEPVAAADLVDAVNTEIDDGATWIKLVADFPLVVDGVRLPESNAPSYDAEALTAAIDAAHRRGVRVAAHTNSPIVRHLVEAGVDSVEHGAGVTEEDLRLLGQQGGAWTPTLCASLGRKPADDEGGRRFDARSAQLRALLPIALAHGVTVMTGSDVAGTVAREVAMLVDHGVTVEQALTAASTAAQDFLGLGGEADIVTYARDPRDDPTVLAEPSSVVVRGVRVR